MFETGHGRSTGDTVRFRGAPSTSASFNNPQNFDGITGANIADSSGYSITVGKRDSSGDIDNTEERRDNINPLVEFPLDF